MPDLEAGIRELFTKWNGLVANGLPRNLVLYPVFISMPDMGITAAMCFNWLGTMDDDAARWCDSLRSLLPVAADTIRPFPPHVAVEEMSKMIPHVAYPGNVQTASTRGLQFSDAAIEALVKYAVAMPPTALLTGIHVLHGVSTEGAGPPNVFRNREVQWP